MKSKKKPKLAKKAKFFKKSQKNTKKATFAKKSQNYPNFGFVGKGCVYLRKLCGKIIFIGLTINK
jgi:hypothetical protein